MLKAGYESFSLGQGREDTFQNFQSHPFTRAFEDVQFSETHWFGIYKALKETLASKSLELNIPWVDHAFKLSNHQGRLQGHLNSINRETDRAMAREDRSIYYEQPHSKTILDPIIFQPHVKEKAPALYLTANKNFLTPYLNHQCDGPHSQSGSYENGFYQSEYTEPIMGTFFDQRVLQYMNPNEDTAVSMKALVKIQVEQEMLSKYEKNRGTFHDKLAMTGSDKTEKFKIQISSITRKVKNLLRIS